MDTLSIKPYFVEDIERKLQSTYFATMNRGTGAAWVIFLLCVEYGINVDFMKPEHIQEIKKAWG